MIPKQRFYIGAPAMRSKNTWGHTTEAAAVEHAKKACRESGEPQIVVKIIAYVEPEVVPIKVTKLR